MLYRDYSRKSGEWIPNKFGGKENLEAVEFLKSLNEQVYKYYPTVQTFAEESSAWPMVTRPTYLGGLGFGMKWDMGWMHDTLEYMSSDPVFRKHHHNKLTFRRLYASTENFVLPLSHDEVVYGKRSLVNKMPGKHTDRFANLRLLLGYMYAQPGKKLLFMGSEFAQWNEWNHDSSLDWHLLAEPAHQGIGKWMTDLNHIYRNEKCLFETDFGKDGFDWIDCSDINNSILSFLRIAKEPKEVVLVVFNFTPVTRLNYRIGAPFSGKWKEVLNSDAKEYGGTGIGNFGQVLTEPFPFHNRPFSLKLTLPPLGALFFKYSPA